MSEKKPRNASMKCQKCVDGISGTDYYGEAVDCHYCGGTSRITANAFCDAIDAIDSQAGDLMRADIILREVYDRCKRLSPDIRAQIHAFISPTEMTE